MDSRKLVMLASLAVSSVMLVGKLTAYFLTSSSAIMADAAESVVHVVATSFAAFSLWFASRPADLNHPYGHGRIAFLSAGFEGALVFSASLAVIGTSLYEMVEGPDVENLGIGLAISAALAAINLILGTSLVIIGKQNNNLIVLANGKHVLTDVYTTAAAIVGLVLVMVTQQKILDPIAALLIGFLITANGVSLMRDSFAGLMDELAPRLRKRLNESIERNLLENGIGDSHDVRARTINDTLWIEMHVLVDGGRTVNDAHAAVTRAEEGIKTDFGEFTVHINSHIEPTDHDQAHPKGH